MARGKTTSSEEEINLSPTQVLAALRGSKISLWDLFFYFSNRILKNSFFYYFKNRPDSSKKKEFIYTEE